MCGRTKGPGLVALALALVAGAGGAPAQGAAGALPSQKEETEAAEAGPARRGLFLELPLLEAPANVPEGYAPSMAQSLWVATDAYELMHYGLGRLVDPYSPDLIKRAAGRLLIGLADLLTVSLPGALAWQHEEGHRAVLSRRGIASHNDVYNFDLISDVIAVSHVRDEDLSRLKREHPAEQVRLSSAGFEVNYLLATNLEALTFFEETRAFHTVAVAYLLLSNIFYLQTCNSGRGDRQTDEMNAREGANVAVRDFTGLDCVGWVYDLHRPFEPYEARGIHPSGVGVDRYRKLTHLTGDERGTLDQQAKLSFLNLVDPFLIGIERLPGRLFGHAFSWNAQLRQQQTPFGHVAGVNLFFRSRSRPLKLLVSPVLYFPRGRALPGLDVTLWRLPWRGWLLSARGALWLQPEDQLFEGTAARPGGYLALRVARRIGGPVEAWLEVDGKSAGWLPGEAALGPKAGARLGLTAALFR